MFQTYLILDLTYLILDNQKINNSPISYEKSLKACVYLSVA